MFCEDPLVVGEATISIESMEEAEKEVEKLLKTRGNCGEEVWEEADARGIIRCQAGTWSIEKARGSGEKARDKAGAGRGDRRSDSYIKIVVATLGSNSRICSLIGNLDNA